MCGMNLSILAPFGSQTPLSRTEKRVQKQTAGSHSGLGSGGSHLPESPEADPGVQQFEDRNRCSERSEADAAVRGPKQLYFFPSVNIFLCFFCVFTGTSFSIMCALLQ